MRPTPACAALSTALAALALAGCGGGADKAGGERSSKPKVLTLANGNGEPGTLQIFANAVQHRSHGTLRIDFQNDWRADTTDYEAGVIHDVGAGKADLGWAGTRAFDDVGVASFDALHAPLLIDSMPLERSALESSLVPEMLDGLEKAHVAGVGILPGPLRKPLGVSPLVRPADYKGVRVALQRSQVAEQTLRALGARGVAIAAAAPMEGYDGIEQQFAAIAGNEYDKVASRLTANVTLWPRPLVIFANPKAMKGLTAGQRDALRGAARAVVPAVLAATQAEEKEAAGILCRRGVKFVTASKADFADLRRAVQPVYDRLEQRAQTKSAIARIRALRSATGAPPDAPTCTGPSPRPTPSTKAAGKRTPLDGIYRLTTSRAETAKLGGESATDVVSENYGQWRFVFSRGGLRYTQASEGARRWIRADYRVKGHVLTMTVTANGGEAPNGASERPGEIFSYHWSLYRDRLTLGPVKGAVSPSGWYLRPLRRVGDAP